MRSRGFILPLSLMVAAIATATSALADDAPIASSALDAYALTDADIAIKCQGSIAQHVDLVQTADGRTITRCEQIYETSRAVISKYHEQENTLVAAAPTASTDCSADQSTDTQAKCLASADVQATYGTKAHLTLRDEADSGTQLLTSVMPANAVAGP